MHAQERQRAASVIQRLLDEPYRFQFFQAVRLLLIWLRKNGIPKDKALATVLRFPDSVSLNFPPSELEAVTIDADGEIDGIAGLQAALCRQPAPKIRLTQAFMGFLGINGGLPYHYSERIMAHQARTRDDGARSFFDTFSGHMVGLFYQAWAKYRLEHRFDEQGQDPLLPLLAALGGVRAQSFVPRRDGLDHGGVNAEVAAYYTGMLRQRPASASAIARVVSDYTAVPIEVEQFVGVWDDIPDDKQTRFGGTTAILGYGATLGGRSWTSNLRVRLHIGPLGKTEFERFLPGSSGARALEKLLGMFGLAGIEFEALLVLNAACVEPIVLCAGSGRGKRLGWDSFIVNKPVTAHRADTRYLLHPC